MASQYRSSMQAERYADRNSLMASNTASNNGLHPLYSTDNFPDSGFESEDSRRSSFESKEARSIESKEIDPKLEEQAHQKLTLRQRIHHYTWAWYTLTMSTGGIATLLAVQPHSFPGLFEFGMALFIINIVFFVFVCTTMVLRFISFPGDFPRSLKHEREGLFFPTFWLSVATLINGTHKYIIQPHENTDMREWLLTSITVAFWTYFVSTFLLAVIQYFFLFSSHTYQLHKMMPSWLLPIFPVMLAGTIASVIAADLPEASRLPILFGGIAAQGLGFFVAIFMYAHYIGRLMQTGLPCREHRTAMFIGVGPPSFTALAFIGMANALPDDVTFAMSSSDTPILISATIIQAGAYVAASALWLLALWFFFIAAAAVIASPPKAFHLGWWAAVFPNSGFAIATIQIGNSLSSEPLKYLGNGLTVALLLGWAFVLFCNGRAVWTGAIMWPGKDEDVAD